MVTYRSKVGSPVEILGIVADNLSTGLDAMDATFPALQAFGVGVAVVNGVTELLTSEARMPQRLGPGDQVAIRRGRTLVVDGDVSTSEAFRVIGAGNHTQRVVLESDLGQRLVCDVDPGESFRIRLEPGERITVHHNFRRP
jgi:hypothetical protein